jgi:O-antigen ligase
MTSFAPSLTRRYYPVRYWCLVALVIGFPNFIAFDSTGLTHKNGLLNITSIGSLTLTMSVAIILAVLSVLTRKPLFVRKVEVFGWLWIALLINMIISTFLQPSAMSGHLVHKQSTDLVVSLYRLGEWSLILLVLLSVYSRETKETATDMIIRLIGLACWARIGLVWLVFPIVPSLVWGTNEDTSETIKRLGGAIVHPVHLAVIAGIACFYALMFWTGARRVIGCTIALATLALTYTRSEQLTFGIVLLGYLLTSRNPKLKVSGIAGILGGVAGCFALSDLFIKYLARGHGQQNITSLSERTKVWRASFHLFWQRPGVGYGFIAGPREGLRIGWNSPNWLPPHCHSDYIQALVSGGIVAGILVACIYARVLWKAARAASQGPKQTFLLLALLQMIVMSTIIVLITDQLTELGAILLLCFVGVIGAEKTLRVGSRHSVSIPKLASARQPAQV